MFVVLLMHIGCISTGVYVMLSRILPHRREKSETLNWSIGLSGICLYQLLGSYNVILIIRPILVNKSSIFEDLKCIMCFLLLL